MEKKTEKAIPVNDIILSWEQARRHLDSALLETKKDGIGECVEYIAAAILVMKEFFESRGIEFDPGLDPTLVEQDFDEVYDHEMQVEDAYLEKLRIEHQLETDGDV